MYQEGRKKTGAYREHLGGGEEGDLIQRGRETMESLIHALSCNTNTVRQSSCEFFGAYLAMKNIAWRGKRVRYLGAGHTLLPGICLSDKFVSLLLRPVPGIPKGNHSVSKTGWGNIQTITPDYRHLVSRGATRNRRLYRAMRIQFNRLREIDCCYGICVVVVYRVRVLVGITTVV